MKVDRLLAFYRTGPQSCSAINVHYSARPGKNYPKGNSENRAAFLVSEWATSTSLSRRQMTSTQSHWAEPPSRPSTATWQSAGTGPDPQWVLKGRTAILVSLDGQTISQRELFLRLKISQSLPTRFWAFLGPTTPFFFPISPFWNIIVCPMPAPPLYS